MKTFNIIALILCVNTISAQSIVNDPHWVQVWGDEFNDGAIDPVWNIGHYMRPGGKCITMNENVGESNGNLIITTKSEPVYCPDLNIGFNYTAAGRCTHETWYPTQSGWAETVGNIISFKYGYLEARIKFAHGSNYHNGFWTFYADGNTNINAGEIDIVESTHNVVNTNVHTCYTQIPLPNGTTTTDPSCYSGSYDLPVPLHTNAFHKFAVEWTPDTIRWYFDDSPYRVVTNHGIVDHVRIILSGNLNSIDDATLNAMPYSSEMLVDYVRAYELQQDCETVVNDCSFNFQAHMNNIAIKKSITIGSNFGSCSNIQTPNSDIHLWATDFIDLKGDYQVPLGSELTLTVENICY